MRCPRCDATILPPATSCGCATAAPTPAAAPAASAAAKPPDGVVGRMVPSKNKPALIGYYLVFVALLPYVPWDRIGVHLEIAAEVRGTFTGATGTIAVVLGAMGVRLARARPEVRGRAHAWLAVIFGGMIAAAWLCAVAGVIKY